MFRLKWLGAGLLGSVLVVGCRHARNDCDCNCGSAYQSSMTMTHVVPTYATGNIAVTTATPPASAASSTSTLPPATAVKHTDIQVAEVKKISGDKIEMRIEAPGGEGMISTTGTIELTTAEAEAMGIRPGYTPNALYMNKAPRSEPAMVRHADLKEEAGKVNPAVPVKGEK